MAVPRRLLVVGDTDGLAQVLQDAKIVDWMDITCQLKGDRANVCLLYCVGRQERRGGMQFVEVFDDGERLGQRVHPILQSRNKPIWIDITIDFRVLLAASSQQVYSSVIVGQSLQSKGNAY